MFPLFELVVAGLAAMVLVAEEVIFAVGRLLEDFVLDFEVEEVLVVVV